MTHWVCSFALGTVAVCWVAAGLGHAEDAPATRPASVRLLVAGDNRGKAGFVDVLVAARRLAGDGGFAGVITQGDADPAATTRKQIENVFGVPTAEKPAPTWYPVVGNHEAASAKEMATLRTYGKDKLAKITSPGPAGCQTTTYSFDAGSMHVVVLDQYWGGQAKEGGKVRGNAEVLPALRQWLEADLKASKLPFKIVCGHEPAYPQQDMDIHTTRHEETALNRNPKARDDFWKTLEAQGVTLYVCGHTHRYSRWHPEGSAVWQVDAGQARNDSSWQYDTFVVLSATADELKIETYRQPKARGKWAVTDTLTLPAGKAQAATKPGA